MKNIVLIGVGALGRRHLQSLMELKDDVNLYAVEVKEHTVELLKKEFPQGVVFVKDMMELPQEIELAVIATSSNVRRAVFEQLIRYASVNYILFEKVLFQQEEDYYFVQEKLKELGIKAWVNCARREWDSYHWLKEKLRDSKKMIVSYTGGQWGLACNGIHILDLIQFLTDGDMGEVSLSYLLPGVVPSKRDGFYEFFGTVTGTCGKCSYFQISCLDAQIPPVLEIVTDVLHVRIEEAHQEIDISEKKNEWDWEKKVFEQNYQSQLTAKVAKSILTCGTCWLTEYEDSMKLHLSYLLPLMGYFQEQGMEGKLCPIT